MIEKNCFKSLAKIISNNFDTKNKQKHYDITLPIVRNVLSSEWFKQQQNNFGS